MIYVVELLSIFPILLGLMLYLFMIFFGNKNHQKEMKKRTKSPRIAFLLPARDESRVIRSLLDSIQHQSVDILMRDVYVIVESRKDPTVEISKEYGASVLYRTTKRPRKGYALDEALKQILWKQHYDLYFIFDADNILDPNYIKNMLPSYYNGYDIGVGYRNCKNGNENVIAAASTLIFSLINTVLNRKRKKNHKNITISGTGFFITGECIESLGGYPFHTLTEDYELSLYAIKHNLMTDYVEEAIYFDEQPITYKQTVHQRERWIAGYFEVRTLYIKDLMKEMKMEKGMESSRLNEIIGVFPIIFLLFGIGWYLFVRFIEVIVSLFVTPKLLWPYLSMILYLFLFIYFVLFLVTFIILRKERRKLNLSSPMFVKVLFYHPLFLLTYVPCALRVLFKKEIEWIPIEHGTTKIG